MVAVDNVYQVMKFKKNRIIYHIILLPSLIVFLFALKDLQLFGLAAYWYVLILYFLGILYGLYVKPGYFKMTIVNDNELQIRYFTMHFADTRKKAIQFHVNQLQNYKIVPNPLGKYKLILTVKSHDQIASYPPISISLLSAKQRHFLASFLDKIIKEVR